MKDNALSKIVKHPDKDEIVSQLVMGIEPSEVQVSLKKKYGDIDSALVLSKKILTDFKDEYLDCYVQIQRDMAAVAMPIKKADQAATALVSGNEAYKKKLEEYLDKEIDVKALIKKFIVAAEFRLDQIYERMFDNAVNTKPDYVVIQWIQTVTNLLEKQDSIINGSPDKIIQQNNINIQILDQHVHVFQDVIRRVIAQLDYETSLMFIDIMNSEIAKIKAPSQDMLSVDKRLEEAQKIDVKFGQLDMPSQ